jgi:hypothetical protein
MSLYYYYYFYYYDYYYYYCIVHRVPNDFRIGALAPAANVLSHYRLSLK